MKSSILTFLKNVGLILVLFSIYVSLGIEGVETYSEPVTSTVFAAGSAMYIVFGMYAEFFKTNEEIRV